MTPHPSRAAGFDISHHNVWADLVKAKASGFGFVYLKATQGIGHVDPVFAARKAAAAAIGLPAGAYLFLEPDADLVTQVGLFIEHVGDNMPLKVALDHETRSVNGARATAEAAQKAVALLQGHYGYTPVLYCDRSFITEGLCIGLGHCPLWIADYSGGIDPGTANARPHLPYGPWSDWTIWQTGQATVPGVTGGDGPGTDINLAPNLELLYAAAVAPDQPTPPDPSPAPHSEGTTMQVIRATGRVAAIVDSAGVGHPISSAKWTAVNNSGNLTVEIATISPANWDAYVPDTARHIVKSVEHVVDENDRRITHDDYDAFSAEVAGILCTIADTPRR